MATYLADPAISASDVLNADVSLEWFKWKRENVEPSTDAQLVGTAFHWLLLEPDIFDSRAPLSPYQEYRTNEAKAWRDEQFSKENVPLRKETRDLLMRMRDKVVAQPWAKDILAGTDFELTAAAKHHKTGLMRRCRWDWVPKGNFLGDIKTTVSASPDPQDGFGKQIWNLGYWRKAAWQLAIWNALNPQDKRENFVLVAVEKDGPCSCQRYRIPAEFLEAAHRLNDATIYKIAEAQRSGFYPGYQDTPHAFAEMPAFAWKAIADQ